MSAAWAQMSVAAWLTMTLAAALWSTWKPRRLVIDARRQRIASILIATSAATEAALLWLGGFFKEVI